jgi:hypothetical protein
MESMTADEAESAGAAVELTAARRSIVTSPSARAEDDSVEFLDVLDSKVVGALRVRRVNDRDRVFCLLQSQPVTQLRVLAQMTNGSYKIVSSGSRASIASRLL